MKYSVSIDLNLPLERVAELMDSEENLFKWQAGLQSMDLLEGVKGEAGAKSKLVFLMGKREMPMVETILVRDFPKRFDAAYEAKGVHNVVRNRFTSTGSASTRWDSENVFEFSGFMRLIGFFMKGAFPKQSLKYMQDFKAFAEDGADVRTRE